jgi:hypothetical protein
VFTQTISPRPQVSAQLLGRGSAARLGHDPRLAHPNAQPGLLLFGHRLLEIVLRIRREDSRSCLYGHQDANEMQHRATASRVLEQSLLRNLIIILSFDRLRIKRTLNGFL